MLFALSQWAHNPRALVVVVVSFSLALVIGISFHEFSHALSAYLLGDVTAQSLGRLTLNPAAHLDPAGSLMLLLVGFGWGKPTPVNPYKLRNGPKAGMAVVSIAGPISNFTLAAIAAIPLKLGLVHAYSPEFIRFWHAGDYVGWFLTTIVFINIILCVFNFIPLAPLDGSKIAAGILPGEMGAFFLRIEPYGMPILMVAFMLSFISPSLSIFSRIMLPLESSIFHLLTGKVL